MFTTLSQGYRMQRAHCRRDLSGDADVPDQYRLIHHLVFRQIEPPVKRTHKGCGLAAGVHAPFGRIDIQQRIGALRAPSGGSLRLFNERKDQGQRTGTARPFPLWRL